MNILYLVTREFPFGSQETFLETELLYSSKFFDKIILLPTKILNYHQTRPLPENVYVDISLSEMYKFSILKTFEFMFRFYNYKLFFKYVLRLNNIQSLYAFLKYCYSYNLYRSFLRSYEFVQNSLIYSYWFNAFVDAFCEVNDKSLLIITRAHGGDIYNEQNQIGFFPQRQKVLNLVNRIFVISNYGKLYFLKHYKVNSNKIVYSPLGVKGKSEFNLLSKDCNVFRFVTVSNIIPLKNLYKIAKTIFCFSKIMRDYKIEWYHFGDGPEKDKFLKYIRDINPESGYFNFFYKGRVRNFEIQDFYSNYYVDVFINLSFSEGVPVSIMEAISFGIPVLASNVGGNTEIVTEEVGKLVSPFENPEKIVKVIIEIINSDMKRENIYKYWKEKYYSEINYLKFLENIKEIY